MKTIAKTFQVYEFSELAEEAKEKAMEHFRETFFDYDWWELLYEGLEQDGIKVTGFDIGRGSYATIELTEDVEVVIENILKNWGKGTDGYKAAKAFKAIFKDLPDSSVDFEDNVDHFLEDIEAIVLGMLREEWEYLNSDDYIAEYFECNEYEFLEDGTVYNN